MRKLNLLPDVAGMVCLVSFVAMILSGGGKALQDADTLWHIRAGLEMLQQGKVLDADIFSHTAFGKQWIAHEWLSEVIMASIHQWSGLSGVAVFYFLLAAFTFWLLFKVAHLKSNNELLAALCVLIAILLAHTHLLARPHLFSWFFGVLTLYLLLRAGRHLYFLPMIMIPWANLHGGFILGLVLQAIFLLEAIAQEGKNCSSIQKIYTSPEIRVRGCILLASIFATFLNPFGPRVISLIFQVHSDVFATNIKEWQAPNLQQLWFFRIYLLLLLVLFMIKKPKLSLGFGIILLFFINSALSHVRHVSLAGIMLTPVLAQILSSLFTRGQKAEKELAVSKVAGPIITTCLFVAIIFPLSKGESFAESITPSFFPLPKEFSPNAIQFIKENRPPGNMLNEYSLGGYLLYSLPDRQNVFIDGRVDMYGEEIFLDYKAMAEMDEGAEELLKKYQISWIIFPKSKPVIKQLKRTDSWDEAYTDDYVSILIHKDSLPEVATR